MKFTITTTGHFYSQARAERLKQLGFQFENDPQYGIMKLDYYDPEFKEVTAEFETLEDLMKFTDRWGSCVISGTNIEIYDDYRE